MNAAVALHLPEDWKVCVDTISKEAEHAKVPQPVLLCIYQQLMGFSDRHKTIFHDEAAAVCFAGSFSQYHTLLRAQPALPLRKFCLDDFTADVFKKGIGDEKTCELFRKILFATEV